MEIFTEDLSKVLFNKEWLVKVDNARSIPYLIKFCVANDALTVCVLLTDTKSAWSEVLTKKQMLRRWRECNPNMHTARGSEPATAVQRALSLTHATGCIDEASFEIVGSIDADLAIELDFGDFKWRWETYLLGPRTSADVISKHLIMPLISLAHISFYSADPVNELAEDDLEKLVDKIGRTARRSPDIHLKHTFARPRIATTLQRVSSLLGFAPVTSRIKSEIDAPDITDLLSAIRAQSLPSSPAPEAISRPSQQKTIHKEHHSVETPREAPPASQPTGKVQSAPQNSETESDSEAIEAESFSEVARKERFDTSDAALPAARRPPVSLPMSREQSQPAGSSKGRATLSAQPAQVGDSGSDSSPLAKKIKAMPSKDVRDSASESDSDVGGRQKSQGSQHISRGPAGRGSGSNLTRGVRQPLKRGAKRF